MKTNPCNRLFRFATELAAGVLLLCYCTSTPLSTEGGGSRGGNPVVVGTLCGPDGSRAGNAKVSLIAKEYNPIADTLNSFITEGITDSLGQFSITAPDTGIFNIEAEAGNDGACLIRFNVKMVRDSTTVVPLDTLRNPGTIKVIIPDSSDLADGYIYVPGTTIMNQITKIGQTLSIESVPPGVLPVLCFGRKNLREKIVIGQNLLITPESTTVVQNWNWRFSRQIILNTSKSGAGTKEDVYDFPVLIRLTQENFDFSEAQDYGQDIRFTSSNGVPLSHEVETWSSDGRNAAIWVKVDTVFGDNGEQTITMYWGNPDAADASDSRSVFDTASGYQAVWHFSDETGAVANDATLNKYNAVSADTARPLAGSGVAGGCRVFNGTNNFYSVPNSSSSKLDFPEDGDFSISAWVLVESYDSLPHVIVAKGYEQYFMRYTGISTRTPLWEFAQIDGRGNWEACSTGAAMNEWTLVTAVRQGKRQLLYCNGVLADSTPDVFASANFIRNTSSDVSIGKYMDKVDIPEYDDGYCYFRGSMDEVRLISAGKSSDWVLLCYMNQRFDDRLVVFR